MHLKSETHELNDELEKVSEKVREEEEKFQK